MSRRLRATVHGTQKATLGLAVLIVARSATTRADKQRPSPNKNEETLVSKSSNHSFITRKRPRSKRSIKKVKGGPETRRETRHNSRATHDIPHTSVRPKDRAFPKNVPRPRTCVRRCLARRGCTGGERRQRTRRTKEETHPERTSASTRKE